MKRVLPADPSAALPASVPRVDYALERSPNRRRTIAIHIKDGGVLVRAPQTASRQRIEEVVAAKAGWIAKKLRENQAQARLAARDYVSGELFKFFGRDYPLVVSEEAIKQIQPAVFIGGCLSVKVPIGRPVADRAAWVRASLERWYRPRAKSVITKAVARWAAATGQAPGLIRVKDLKRSWGVCTGANISFNWRLIMAPLPLIDYVVVHELCHLKHKNHSSSFYGLLASFVPDYKERRRALRDLAPYLDL